MLVLPSPPSLAPDPLITSSYIDIGRREPSTFKNSVVPVVLLSILAACIVIPFVSRIAYLKWTGRDWTGCLQPSRPQPTASTGISANHDLLRRELAVSAQLTNFAPGSYTAQQPPRVRTLVVPSAGNVSVPELPKLEEHVRDAPSRLSRIASFSSRRSGRGTLESPLRVHVRVSTVYDRPGSDEGSTEEGHGDGSAHEREVDDRSLVSERSETRSPPPAYSGSGHGHD